jgi:hypothetical protein
VCVLAAICQEVLARDPPTPPDSGTVGYYWVRHEAALSGHECAPGSVVRECWHVCPPSLWQGVLARVCASCYLLGGVSTGSANTS